MKEYFDKLYLDGVLKFYKDIKKSLKNGEKKFIVTANPETFITGTKDGGFDKLLNDDVTTLVPDGIGIVAAAKKLNYNVKERITGVDLASELLKVCNENEYSLALLGAKKDVLEMLVSKIKEEYPNIKIVLTQDGYNKDKDKFFDKIVDKNVDVCLVALGIPTQEKLIYKHIDRFSKGIFVGVGGSFDVLSGSKKRAPKIFIKLNLEWFYRIIKEPKRIKRFWNNNVKFLFSVKKNYK